MSEHPLVSAIMLIRKSDIAELEIAIECFEKQTYPYKELIIINNANTQFEASGVNIDARENVFLVDTPSKLPAGSARNYGILAANGQILAQFDADCWHDPHRLEHQILEMAKNSAHICMLSRGLCFSYNSGRVNYWENGENYILNTMIYVRPSNIDYSQVDKGEEYSILTKMFKSGMIVTYLNKPEYICKIVPSDEPRNEITLSSVSEQHKKVIENILMERNT